MCVGFASDLIDGRGKKRGKDFDRVFCRGTWPEWMTDKDCAEGQRLIERLDRAEIDQVWAAEWFCMLTDNQLDALHWRERQLQLT